MKRSLPFAGSNSSFRFGSRLTLAAAGWLCVLLLGCSRQGEGERCDTNNNNEDCESGLECRQLRSPNRGAVCCSENSTEEVCQRFMLDDFDDTETEDTATESTETESENETTADASPGEAAPPQPEAGASEPATEMVSPAEPEAGAVTVEAGVVPVDASVVSADGTTP
jgi:hypothetical protein